MIFRPEVHTLESRALLSLAMVDYVKPPRYEPTFVSHFPPPPAPMPSPDGQDGDEGQRGLPPGDMPRPPAQAPELMPPPPAPIPGSLRP